MRVAGYRIRTPLHEEPHHLIHKACHGAPRLILQMADTALLEAMARKEKMIDGYLAHELAQDPMGVAA